MEGNWSPGVKGAEALLQLPVILSEVLPGAGPWGD